MVTRLVQPSSDRPLLKDGGSPNVQFNSWLKTVSDRALIIGTGSPESVVEANQGAIYMDDSGIAGAILYIKRDADDGLGPVPDKTKGWVLV
ncbi:hypothetical protein [Pseudoalteromonas sp.]|uniref:hypothetical protein n=1 Tax=Pseudoalteromonas sp. TaxID=53249 RepID=UPI003563A026